MKVFENQLSETGKADFSKLRTLLQVALSSVLIGICAQIEIPLPCTPVPLTGQTLGVMLVGALLGSRKGAFAALLYLLQGTLGAPVWAGGNAGWHHLIGPTGGYLISYPLEAYLIGYFLERQKTFGIAKTIGALLIPSSAQLGIGSLWLSNFVGQNQCLIMGFYPFISVEIGKAFAVTLYLKLRNRK